MDAIGDHRRHPALGGRRLDLLKGLEALGLQDQIKAGSSGASSKESYDEVRHVEPPP